MNFVDNVLPRGSAPFNERLLSHFPGTWEMQEYVQRAALDGDYSDILHAIDGELTACSLDEAVQDKNGETRMGLIIAKRARKNELLDLKGEVEVVQDVVSFLQDTIADDYPKMNVILLKALSKDGGQKVIELLQGKSDFIRNKMDMPEGYEPASLREHFDRSSNVKMLDELARKAEAIGPSSLIK